MLGLMNLHPHAVLNRVLWRWYQSPFPHAVLNRVLWRWYQSPFRL